MRSCVQLTSVLLKLTAASFSPIEQRRLRQWAQSKKKAVRLSAQFITDNVIRPWTPCLERFAPVPQAFCASETSLGERLFLEKQICSERM